MLTDFRNRLTYFGTLDDVVYRYPWPCGIDLQSIQQQLVTCAIYDKKILINDGYLITNPELLGQLKDIDRTLVGNLLMMGGARLFARGGKTNLAEGIERNARNIPTHREVVSGSGWTTMRDDLEFLSGEVEKYTLPWPSDKNMGEMFYQLLKRVRGMDAAGKSALLPAGALDDFDAVFDRFDKAIQKPSFRSARSVWEDQCWIFYSGKTVPPPQIAGLKTEERAAAFKGYGKVRLLMNVANEVYHLAYTVAAYHSLQGMQNYPGVDSATMGISSSLITAFPDLLGPEQSMGEENPAKTAALNQLLITIPARLKFKDDFSFVARLTTNGDCRRARSNYLKTIGDFVDDTASEAQAIVARDAYVENLKRQLAPGVKRGSLEYIVGRAVDIVTAPLDLLPLGQLAKFASSMVMPIGVDHLNTLLVERLVQARVKAALREDGVVAVQTAGSVPLVRQLGLYFGPIKADGGNSLLKDIAPPG